MFKFAIFHHPQSLWHHTATKHFLTDQTHLKSIFAMILAPKVTLSQAGVASYLKMTSSTTTLNESFPLPLYLCAGSVVIKLIARNKKSCGCHFDCCHYWSYAIGTKLMLTALSVLSFKSFSEILSCCVSFWLNAVNSQEDSTLELQHSN